MNLVAIFVATPGRCDNRATETKVVAIFVAFLSQSQLFPQDRTRKSFGFSSQPGGSY